MSPSTRRAATLGLAALVLSLPAAPVLAQDAPLTDPVTALLAPTPSPSPLLPLPEPVKGVVEAVVEQLEKTTGPAPAPAPAAPAPAPAPAPVTGQGSAPQQVAPAGSTAGALAAGTGAASLGALSGVPGLRAGVGTAAVPALGAPMVAAAPAYLLPSLAGPQIAPEVQAARPASSNGTPAGLPGLAVVVAAVAVAAAAGAHAHELRVRRAAVRS